MDKTDKNKRANKEIKSYINIKINKQQGSNILK